MDDLWGDDDLDADVVEECLMLASQATINNTTSNFGTHQHQQHEEASQISIQSSNVFEFKQPTKPVPAGDSRLSSRSMVQRSNDCQLVAPSNQADVAELERLKEENKRLAEANLTRAGEASILRADVQSLKTTLERREVESSQQLAALRKQVQQMDANHHKQIEASKTEMKFKELELEELRSKCRRIEQSKTTEQLAASAGRLMNSSVRESPTSGKFLNKTAFESAKVPDRSKLPQADAEVQTDTVHRFRLDPTDAERLDVAPATDILIDTLKYSLLSTNTTAGPGSSALLLEQLGLRIVIKADEEDVIKLLVNDIEPSIGELVCNNLERVKNTELYNAHVEFLTIWIVHVLPWFEQEKSNRFIQSLLSEVKRCSFSEIFPICSAVVSRFGLAPVCNKATGCLMEKAALQFKDAYPSLSIGDQLRSTEKLILSLCAMIASPPSTEDLKKCACIAHLLKALTLSIQHLVLLDTLDSSVGDRRLKLLVQAFRLSLSVLHCRREPWVTFAQTPAEVNRLFTVLTAVSVDFPIPKELSHEINVAAFYTGAGV